MTWETPSAFNRFSRWLCGLLLASVPATCLAFTALPFAPVRQPLTNEIAELTRVPSPTAEQVARLRTLNLANDVLEKSSLNDGKVLRALAVKLRRLPEYATPLETVATNLVNVLTNRYNFIGTVLDELPPSAGASNVQKQYVALQPLLAKLLGAVSAKKTPAVYDLLRSRLDKIFSRADKLLLVQFPADLASNQIDATIVDSPHPYFKTTATAATENLFSAIATGTNIAITVSAIDFPKGILFSIPNVSFGTARYTVPGAVTFTNRTDVYTANERASVATNGVFFISASASRVYGIFECSGADFQIVKGRFLIDVTSQP